MAVIRRGTTIQGAINQHTQDMRTLDKKNLARVNDLQAKQVATAKQAAATEAKATDTASTVASMLGQGGASALPALNSDTNTGSSWATGERQFINNLNTNVIFILTALENAGIITP